QDSCATDCATPAMPGKPPRSDESGTTDECRSLTGRCGFLASSQQGGLTAYEIKLSGGRANADFTICHQENPPRLSRGNAHWHPPGLDAQETEFGGGRGVAPDSWGFFDWGDQAT